MAAAKQLEQEEKAKRQAKRSTLGFRIFGFGVWGGGLSI